MPEAKQQNRFTRLADFRHFPTLTEKVRFATFQGEIVYIIFEGQFGAREKDDTARFMCLWRENDYSRIVVDLSAAFPTKQFVELLRASKVEMIDELTGDGKAA